MGIRVWFQGGNTILHLAARHGQDGVIEVLQQMSPKLTFPVDVTVLNSVSGCLRLILAATYEIATYPKTHHVTCSQT
eukprot:85825-Pyramimonas_sp.AAC.2